MLALVLSTVLATAPTYNTVNTPATNDQIDPTLYNGHRSVGNLPDDAMSNRGHRMVITDHADRSRTPGGPSQGFQGGDHRPF